MSELVPRLLFALTLAGWIVREWRQVVLARSEAQDEEATRRRDEAIRTADAHREAQLAEDEVKRANELIRKGTGAALCLTLLVAPSLARAEEPCRREGEAVVCTREGFQRLMTHVVELEHARSVAKADTIEARARHAACATQVAALQRFPEPSPWLWIGTGVLGVAAGVALTVLVTR